MNLQRIAYFVTLARTLSFTRTAKEHYISQAAVTQQIRQLEEELNVKLFHRNNRKVELTPAGKLYYDQAVKILDLVEHSMLQLKSMSQEQPHSINIGLLGVSNSFMIDLIGDFCERHPSINLNFHRESYDFLMKVMQDRTCDASVCLAPASFDPPRIRSIPLTDLPVYVVASEKSRFAQYESLTIDQINGTDEGGRFRYSSLFRSPDAYD